MTNPFEEERNMRIDAIKNQTNRIVTPKPQDVGRRLGKQGSIHMLSSNPEDIKCPLCGLIHEFTSGNFNYQDCQKAALEEIKPEEIYGKSELEQPKFSTIDMQFVLNEKRTLEMKIAALEKTITELQNPIGIHGLRKEVEYKKRLDYLEQENKALKEQLGGDFQYGIVSAETFTPYTYTELTDQLAEQKEITRKTIERNLELDAKMVEVVRVGEKMANVLNSLWTNPHLGLLYRDDCKNEVEKSLSEWRALKEKIERLEKEKG